MNKRKYVVAIDSMKGCLSSAEANSAAAEGIAQADGGADVLQIAVSDGGEGWLEALAPALQAQRVTCPACDALLRPLDACYAVSGTTAIIEVAQTIGLPRVAGVPHSVLAASSRGAGLLLAHAYARGCRRFIVGLGGTATCDCGEGLLSALQEARLVEPLGQCELLVATDVTTPLLGPDGAARLFAPQKGATPAQVELLEARAAALAERNRQTMGHDCSRLPGAGAAGGLGYALMQHLHAQVRDGAQLLLDLTGFDALLQHAALVVTGEGAADRQTLLGKLPHAVMLRARRQGVPTLLLAGRVAHEAQLLAAGFAAVVGINPPGLPPHEALQPAVAQRNIASAMARWLQAEPRF